MRNRYCVHVGGSTLSEFTSNLRALQNSHNFLELRVDRVGDLSVDMIAELRSNCTTDAILTCRNLLSHGGYTGAERERISILEAAINLDFQYVDVELECIDKIKTSSASKTKLIASYHNFNHTPDISELTEIFLRGSQCGAEILKIATQVNTLGDNAHLLAFLLEKARDFPLVIVGMGHLGRPTRILSPLLGGLWTYTSVDETTAGISGQVHPEIVEQIYGRYFAATSALDQGSNLHIEKLPDGASSPRSAHHGQAPQQLSDQTYRPAGSARST